MKKIILTGLLSIVLIFTSCENLLDINDNPNYPKETNAEASIPSAEAQITGVIGGDLQLIGSIWSQFYAQHTGSNQYTNIDSYNLPTSNSYNSRTWNLLYAGALPDLDNAIKDAETNKKWSFWFMAKTLKAFTFHLLNSYYGDIPFSQATQGITVNPKYDPEKEVYLGTIKILDEALAKAGDAKTENGTLTDNQLKNDLLLDGKITSWIKFAKTLKLKLLLRDYNTNKAAITALLTENDLLTMDVAFKKFEDKENLSNPLFENDRRKLNTPNNLRASSTMMNYLLAKKDPRDSVFYEGNAAAGAYVGLPQGGYTLGSSWTSRTSRAQLAAIDYTYFMSEAESYFIQAECYARANNVPKAKEYYDKGVLNAFSKWKLNDLPLNGSYFIAAGGVYEFDVTSEQKMLESIWRQKWIASVRTQGWDAFLEINRTGFPEYGTVATNAAGYVVGNLAPSINSVLPAGEFPRRLVYPKSSTDFNPNASAVVPLQTKMWWHKQ